MITNDKIIEIRNTGYTGTAVQKAKLYNEHVELLLDSLTELREKLEDVQADPELLSKLKEAAKIDPSHLRRLLALEKAVNGAGYCGMPTG